MVGIFFIFIFLRGGKIQCRKTKKWKKSSRIDDTFFDEYVVCRVRSVISVKYR